MADGFYHGLIDALANSWRRVARPEQIAPTGDWSTWLIMAGRGFGKTRAGSEWVHEQVAYGVSRIALVGPTMGDVREFMVEGMSGVLRTAPSWARPVYEISKRRVTWPNGAIATLFSAEEPERLRGPEHHAAWCDEVGSWDNQQPTWDMLQFGLRLGRSPRALVTTTPKPTPVLRKLLKAEGNGVVVTRGTMLDNAANLPAAFLKTIRERYEGTRLGRQEIDGELLVDVLGALWTPSNIDEHRVGPGCKIETPPSLRRVVVAVDPAVSNNEGSDEHGIVVAGESFEEHGYVLADGSLRGPPNAWAAKAIALYDQFQADCIVCEANQGGLLVENTIRAMGGNMPIRLVHATRGKVTRAEPAAALYEQGRIHHVGHFKQLEDQQCAFTSDFDRGRAGYSPDRLDALVWAITELMLKKRAPVAQSGTYAWG